MPPALSNLRRHTYGGSRVARGALISVVALCAQTHVCRAESSALAADSARAAQPTASDHEEAKRLYAEGRALYGRGDYEGAAQAFLDAHERAPASRLLFNIAQALRLAKRCSEAVDYYERARASGLKLPDDFEANAAKALKCAEEARAAETPPSPPAALEPPPSAPAQVTPEGGTSRAANPGASSASEVSRAQGGPATTAAKASQSDASGKAPEDDSRPWGYAASGIGLVGLGVGAVAGIMAIDAKNELDDPALCDASSCSSKGADVQEQGKLYSTVSTVGFSVGLVGLGVGAYLLFIGSDDPEPKPAAATVEVARLDGGLHVTVGTSL